MDNKYISALHGAILSFQMIEEALKIIVGLSYEIVQESTPAPVKFKFSKDMILDAPLGRLIQMYSQVSDNDEMVAHLRKASKWRNFCAHNAFRHELYVRTGKEQFSAHSHEDLLQVVQHCSELVETLGAEVVSLQELHKQKVKNAADSNSNGT